MELLPGDKVLVYDAWANGREGYYNGDGEWAIATVVKRYGKLYDKRTRLGPYEDLIDVIFDHDGRLSKGHFNYGNFEPIPV